MYSAQGVSFNWIRPKSLEDGKIPTKQVKAKVCRLELTCLFLLFLLVLGVTKVVVFLWLYSLLLLSWGL